jgi:hypothetical protein
MRRTATSNEFSKPTTERDGSSAVAARSGAARYAPSMVRLRARTRHLAVLGAALAAGAFEAAHGLAWQGRLAVWPIAFEIVGMIIELEVLAAVFDHGLTQRRSAAWSAIARRRSTTAFA